MTPPSHYDPNKHHRRSIRLNGYDYTQPGAYFITICTFQRACIFGEIIKDELQQNPYGRVAVREWKRLSHRFPSTILDAFTVMPNHIHGIIIINETGRGTAEEFHEQIVETTCRAPTQVQFGRPVSRSIPTIVRSYKSSVSLRIHHLRNAPTGPIWQKNYYEHVIRNEGELQRIRAYIQTNPDRWETDTENPNRLISNT